MDESGQHRAVPLPRKELRARLPADAYRLQFAEVARQAIPGVTDPSRLDAEVAVRLGGSSKSLSCVPIPGHFFEGITVAGKPAQMLVQLSVDGAVVLDRTETPGYLSNEPNGPGCDPTCQQASAQWMFSAP